MVDDARPPSRRERVGLGERAVLGSAGGEGGSELLAGREGGLGDGQRVGRLEIRSESKRFQSQLKVLKFLNETLQAEGKEEGEGKEREG